MPLDNTREYPHQRLLDLEGRLRKRDFPFIWDSFDCSRCAMAIDCIREGQAMTYPKIAEYYGITEYEAKGIFSAAWHFHGKSLPEITPDDVAGTIRGVLEKVLA